MLLTFSFWFREAYQVRPDCNRCLHPVKSSVPSSLSWRRCRPLVSGAASGRTTPHPRGRPRLWWSWPAGTSHPLLRQSTAEERFRAAPSLGPWDEVHPGVTVVRRPMALGSSWKATSWVRAAGPPKGPGGNEKQRLRRPASAWTRPSQQPLRPLPRPEGGVTSKSDRYASHRAPMGDCYRLKTTRWTTAVRMKRSFADGVANGSIRP